MQSRSPVRGDWPLPEWDGQLVQIKLEQSACFDGESVHYLAGRQTNWHIVR